MFSQRITSRYHLRIESTKVKIRFPSINNQQQTNNNTVTTISQYSHIKGVQHIRHRTSTMNLIKTVSFVLLGVGYIHDTITVVSALQFPSSEMSRRTAINIATASSAVIASGSTPSVCVAQESVGGPSVLLNSKNKKQFPLASFGLQVYNDDTAYKLTLTALEVGYRNFFASVLAGNQKGFAKVISLLIILNHSWCFKSVDDSTLFVYGV